MKNANAIKLFYFTSSSTADVAAAASFPYSNNKK